MFVVKTAAEELDARNVSPSPKRTPRDFSGSEAKLFLQDNWNHDVTTNDSLWAQFFLLPRMIRVYKKTFSLVWLKDRPHELPNSNLLCAENMHFADL